MASLNTYVPSSCTWLTTAATGLRKLDGARYPDVDIDSITLYTNISMFIDEHYVLSNSKTPHIYG